MHQKTFDMGEKQREMRGENLHQCLMSSSQRPSGRATAWAWWERGWRRWCFLSLLRETLDREGVSVGRTAHDEHRAVCRRLPPLYIRRWQGPTTIDWLSAPDQGASKGPFRPLGLIGVEIILTLMSSVKLERTMRPATMCSKSDSNASMIRFYTLWSTSSCCQEVKSGARSWFASWRLNTIVSFDKEWERCMHMRGEGLAHAAERVVYSILWIPINCWIDSYTAA
jgi:hypothetical protein